jgi:hypothetical protein
MITPAGKALFGISGQKLVTAVPNKGRYFSLTPGSFVCAKALNENKTPSTSTKYFLI